MADIEEFVIVETPPPELKNDEGREETPPQEGNKIIYYRYCCMLINVVEAFLLFDSSNAFVKSYAFNAITPFKASKRF